MKFRHVVAAAAVAAASFGGAEQAEAQYLGGGIWMAATNEMMFTFLGREATYQHELSLYTYTMGGTDASLGARSSVGSIFNIPPVPTVGTTVTVGGLTPGQFYVLGLFVPNNGLLFFSDGFAYNPTTMMRVTDESANWSIDGTAGVTYNVARAEDTRDNVIDEDFNDLVVGVSTVPEPGTVALLATGLIALGGFGAARRRKTSAV